MQEKTIQNVFSYNSFINDIFVSAICETISIDDALKKIKDFAWTKKIDKMPFEFAQEKHDCTGLERFFIPIESYEIAKKW